MTPHYVYIFSPGWKFEREGNKKVFKVGITKNPEDRLNTFKTAYPCDVHMLTFKFFSAEMARAQEKKIHRYYRKYMTKGGGTEWFLAPVEVMYEIHYRLAACDLERQDLFVPSLYRFFVWIRRKLQDWRNNRRVKRIIKDQT